MWCLALLAGAAFLGSTADIEREWTQLQSSGSDNRYPGREQWLVIVGSGSPTTIFVLLARFS